MRPVLLGALALAAVVVAAPAAARTPTPSLFGLNTGTFDPDYAHYVRDLPAARALGARWVHFTGSLVKYDVIGLDAADGGATKKAR